MTDRDLGRELLTWDAVGPVPDIRQVVARVLDRDRRRMRWLAGLTVVLWGLTAAGVLTTIYFYLWWIHPKVLFHIRQGYTPEFTQTWHIAISTVVYWLAGVTVVLLLAAVSTVAFVAASRRATLRQVNANLREISEQLKALRPGPG